jgi:endonuclease G
MKKISFLWLLAALMLIGNAFAETDHSIIGDASKLKTNPYCQAQVYKGELPVIESKNLLTKTRLGCYDNFTILHSGIAKTALWSAEHLTRENVLLASKIKRVDAFHVEDKLPADERAELVNYARSGYDRGHMAPNKDMPNAQAQYQCFTLANMMPQNPNNNRVLWEGIEAATRTLAKEKGELYVVTGPLFLTAKLQSLQGVLIPTHIFKAIYNPSTGEAAAYIVNNTEGMDYKMINIDQLQRLSGVNVFPFLSKEKMSTMGKLLPPSPHNEKNLTE